MAESIKVTIQNKKPTLRERIAQQQREAAAKKTVLLIIDDSASMVDEWPRVGKAVSMLLARIDRGIHRTLASGLVQDTIAPLMLDLNEVSSILKPTHGYTPLFTRLLALTPEQNEELRIEQIILISDGAPTSPRGTSPDAAEIHKLDAALAHVHKLQVPIDTVYIGPSYDTRAKECLSRISKETNGIALAFEDLDKFTNTLQYLAPATRLMLQAGEIKENK